MSFTLYLKSTLFVIPQYKKLMDYLNVLVLHTIILKLNKFCCVVLNWQAMRGSLNKDAQNDLNYWSKKTWFLLRSRDFDGLAGQNWQHFLQETFLIEFHFFVFVLCLFDTSSSLSYYMLFLYIFLLLIIFSYILKQLLLLFYMKQTFLFAYLSWSNGHRNLYWENQFFRNSSKVFLLLF